MTGLSPADWFTGGGFAVMCVMLWRVHRIEKTIEPLAARFQQIAVSDATHEVRLKRIEDTVYGG